MRPMGCQNSVRIPRNQRFADRTLILAPHALQIPAGFIFGWMLLRPTTRAQLGRASCKVSSRLTFGSTRVPSSLMTVIWESVLTPDALLTRGSALRQSLLGLRNVRFCPPAIRRTHEHSVCRAGGPPGRCAPLHTPPANCLIALMNKRDALTGCRVPFGLLGFSAVVTEIATSVERGGSSLTNFLSYFTVESNSLAAAILILSALALAGGKQGRLIAMLRGASTLNMILVGVLFTLLLSGVEDAEFTAVPWIISCCIT